MCCCNLLSVLSQMLIALGWVLRYGASDLKPQSFPELLLVAFPQYVTGVTSKCPLLMEDVGQMKKLLCTRVYTKNQWRTICKVRPGQLPPCSLPASLPHTTDFVRTWIREKSVCVDCDDASVKRDLTFLSHVLSLCKLHNLPQ